ncbi:MAG: murB [Clostridia bacterium]|jgi:UDP-N-acetylmuramate dehydrogenase|nr:murB [Clostridia bacterium]
MEIKELADILRTKIPNGNIAVNELMSKHTSFKIGGPADLFITPTDIVQLAEALRVCRDYKVPFYIIGNGSNLLIDDKGFRGIIIQLCRNFSQVVVEDTKITAYSGATLAKIANRALDEGLADFEFAQGIPGTLGGAVAMNAGAYGREIKDVIISADVIDHEGNIITLSKDELALGYRTSIVQKNHYIVIKAVLGLQKGDKCGILERMKDLADKRRDKQPLDMPSAGSAFKRPEGHFAGKLIMDCGLSGYKIGGAMVSEKHCGFVVSDGTATFEDVIKLIEHIKKTVKDKFDVELHPEVRIITSNR